MQNESELSNNDAISRAYKASSVHQVLQNETRDGILEMLQQKIDSDCFSEIGDTVLHSVLRNEKLLEKEVVEILTIFLTRGVGSNIVNILEQTALHLAVGRRMKDAVNLLLKFKSNIHKVNERGNSIAHFFIVDEYEKCKVAMFNPLVNTEENREIRESNSMNFLQFFMSKNVEFDRKNEQGESALHLAVKYQLLHIIPTLLEHTNDLMFVNKNNKTLLHLLLEGRSHLPDEHLRSGYISRNVARIVEILLDKGVPILASDKYGCTLISDAVKRGEERVIIETLINHYLNSCDDKNVVTTLFDELMSTCTLWSDSDTEYFLTVLRDLVIKGADINNETPQNRLWLTDKEVKNFALLEFFKEFGIAYTVRLTKGKNLLHMLAEEKDYLGPSSQLYSHICDLVFSGNCEVNTVDKRGQTALQMAARHGNVQMVQILLELGADVNHRDDVMRTPLHDAEMTSESVEMIELLLSNGADVNAKDHASETPLYSAVSGNNVAIVRSLLQHNASVNCQNKCQQTPLHRALSMDAKVEIVELLLTNGANVNASDSNGDRPLHHLKWRKFDRCKPILKMLLEKGAYVDAQNNEGESALCCALKLKSRVTLIVELLKHGADLNSPGVQRLLSSSRYWLQHDILWQHLAKLKAVNLPLDEEYEAYIDRYDYYQDYQNKCLNEVEKLKSTIIDNDNSLYDLLHMKPTRRRAYTSGKKLQQLVESPELSEQFPLYSVVILGSYRGAVAKKSLLERAQEALNSITRLQSPDCVEQILAYLDENDLMNLVDANNYGDEDDN